MTGNEFLGGPDIKVGSVWSSADGSGSKVVVIAVERWLQGTSEWDYTIVYEHVAPNGMRFPDSMPYDKDAWSFQVRYNLEQP